MISQTAYIQHTHELALELHDLLRDLDSARWRDANEGDSRARLVQIQGQLKALARGPEEEQAADPVHRLERLGAALDVLASLLEQAGPGHGDSAAQIRRSWMEFRKRVQPAYEDVARNLRAAQLEMPVLRPTNWSRSILHFTSAMLGLAVVETLDHMSTVLTLAVGWAAFCWSLEATRAVFPVWNESILAVLGRFAHPHEHHKVNSATWYATALVGLCLTMSPPLIAVAITVLGVGDPLAATIGRRWGRIRLVHGRSLEGTVAFVLSSALAAGVVLTVFHADIGLHGIFLMATAAAVFGGVTELFTKGLDDNLTIPLVAATAAGVTALFLGLPI